MANMNEKNPFSLTTLVSGYTFNMTDAVNTFVSSNDLQDSTPQEFNSSKNFNGPDPPL